MGKERRKAETDQEYDPMRAPVLACLVSLAGCIIDNDPVRVESFTADTPQTFTYGAQTNTVMTANDDGAAERIRRDCQRSSAAPGCHRPVGSGQRNRGGPRREFVIWCTGRTHIRALQARLGADDK